MKIIIKLKTLGYDLNKYVLRGDKEKRLYFIKKYKEKLNKLKNRLNTKKMQEQKKALDDKIESYLTDTKKYVDKPFIFMFSGTTYIQEKRGNRPIRLTNTWLEKGYPVLFSYYRWNKMDKIPSYDVDGLCQVPIDVTMEWMDRIINYDFGDKEKIFIVSFPYPEIARFVGQLKEKQWKVLYDVRDNWEEFHKVNMAKWYNESMEKFFVCNSDVVCAVAQPLQEKMQQYTQKKIVKLSPNALDKKFLDSSRWDRSQNAEIVIGYVGHLSAGWFDWEAIIEAAEQKPEWKFEIIGHFEPDQLKLPSNVHMLGSKEHKEIKEITKRWKVAIIPFKIGALSDCVDPIKIYEYLAMGLPVVSFRMPQIHDYPNTYIAHEREDFVKTLEKAIAKPFEYDKSDRFLAVNTWEDRADEIIEWLRLEKKQ